MTFVYSERSGYEDWMRAMWDIRRADELVPRLTITGQQWIDWPINALVKVGGGYVVKAGTGDVSIKLYLTKYPRILWEYYLYSSPYPFERLRKLKPKCKWRYRDGFHHNCDALSPLPSHTIEELILSARGAEPIATFATTAELQQYMTEQGLIKVYDDDVTDHQMAAAALDD